MTYDVEGCRIIGREAQLFHQEEYDALVQQAEALRPHMDYHRRQIQNWEGYLHSLGAPPVSHSAEIIPFVPQQAPPSGRPRHLTVLEGGLTE